MELARDRVVQSMTNTDTADPESTATQVAELFQAGSELVRITVNTQEAATAVPEIRQRLLDQGLAVPLIGHFHYGHVLLRKFPAGRFSTRSTGAGSRAVTQSPSQSV